MPPAAAAAATAGERRVGVPKGNLAAAAVSAGPACSRVASSVATRSKYRVRGARTRHWTRSRSFEVAAMRAGWGRSHARDRLAACQLWIQMPEVVSAAEMRRNGNRSTQQAKICCVSAASLSSHNCLAPAQIIAGYPAGHIHWLRCCQACKWLARAPPTTVWEARYARSSHRRLRGDCLLGPWSAATWAEGSAAGRSLSATARPPPSAQQPLAACQLCCEAGGGGQHLPAAARQRGAASGASGNRRRGGAPRPAARRAAAGAATCSGSHAVDARQHAVGMAGRRQHAAEPGRRLRRRLARCAGCGSPPAVQCSVACLAACTRPTCSGILPLCKTVSTCLPFAGSGFDISGPFSTLEAVAVLGLTGALALQLGSLPACPTLARLGDNPSAAAAIAQAHLTTRGATECFPPHSHCPNLLFRPQQTSS